MVEVLGTKELFYTLKIMDGYATIYICQNLLFTLKSELYVNYSSMKNHAHSSYPVQEVMPGTAA